MFFFIENDTMYSWEDEIYLCTAPINNNEVGLHYKIWVLNYQENALLILKRSIMSFKFMKPHHRCFVLDIWLVGCV